MILYNIGIYLAVGLAHIVALFNRKVRVFVKGRQNLFHNLAVTLQAQEGPIVWMHCASLGEFEQGRPIIEQWRQQFPSYKIVLTFFSPSGYEACKGYNGVDFVFYLPWDIASHIKKFIALVKPTFVVIIKYEFWFNLVNELHKNNIPLILVSALFRKNQLFFKPFGFLYRSILFRYSHFFVQNMESVQLLHSIGIDKVTLAGDSRVDRVYQIAQRGESVPIVERFKGSHPLFIAGSCWPEDMPLLISFINNSRGKTKFIIAPHNIDESFMVRIEKALLAKSIRYSRAANSSDEHTVLLIDNIGLLARLYRYGEFAYVGGGFRTGLHNILEPACYGMPIFFGHKNYQKFEEATALIACGGAFAVRDYAALEANYKALNSQPEKYTAACEAAIAYILKNIGASKKVIAYCSHLIGPQ